MNGSLRPSEHLGAPPRRGSTMSDIADLYINRELSWLDFDARVLEMVDDASVPLLERVMFSSIFSSNLDEFYQVRVAMLKGQQDAGSRALSPDGLSATEQLVAIRAAVGPMVDRQESVLLDVIFPLLEAQGVTIVSWLDLAGEERKHLVEMYEQRVFPILTPLAVDPSHPFPYISNLSLNLAVSVRNPDTGERRFARVKVPPLFPRLARLPGSHRFVLIEQVIAAQLPTLFPGMEIEGWWTFRVTRNADLPLEEGDAEDLLVAVETELKRRRFGRSVRLEVTTEMPDEVEQLLIDQLDLTLADVTRHRAPIDLTCLDELHALDLATLKFKPWPNITAGRVATADMAGRSLFSVIRERDLLVHHPYESFASSIEEFIEQAAEAPAVQTIKMTLYRTSGDSAIAHSLIRAAERGVQVAAMVEIKARFDEATNVEWAKALEQAGVHVVYGLSGLKTHSKCVLVVRADDDGLRRYVHLGTGNYNSRTARLYEDVGYFTCDPDIGADASQLFNHLTGFAREQQYRSLLVAPEHLRRQLLELIERESEHGTEGRITAKMNSLGDPRMVRALYDASQVGVHIDLIVRGLCCLRPGVPGVSETIRVRSILGRYLEHSRIFRFAHGDIDGGPFHLIGSADMMPRNLDFRVETLVPVRHPRHQFWLDSVFEFQLGDDVNCWELQPDGGWTRQAGGVDVQEQMQRWVEDRQRPR